MELAQRDLVAWAIVAWAVPFLGALAMIMSGYYSDAKTLLGVSAVSPILALVGVAALSAGWCGW